MLLQLKKKEVKNNRISLVGYAGEETETSTNNASTKINALMKEKLEFLVEVDEEITDAK